MTEKRKFVEPEYNEEDTNKDICCPFCKQVLGEVVEPICDVISFSPYIQYEGAGRPQPLFVLREVPR